LSESGIDSSGLLIVVVFMPVFCFSPGCEETFSFFSTTYLLVSVDTNVLPVSAFSLPPYSESLSDLCAIACEKKKENKIKKNIFICLFYLLLPGKIYPGNS
jgi:hypothetical protein